MTETQWLSPEERDAWVRFVTVLELLPGVLDSQLGRESGLTYFEYMVLAMLSEAKDRTLRTAHLAQRTSATLPRLSKVLNRLESQGLVERSPCAEDRRATNVALTERGWEKVVSAAPGHVDAVRAAVFDRLEPAQVQELSNISINLLAHLDPEGKFTAPALDQA